MPSTTITATGSKGHHIFELTVAEAATSTTNNTSTITFSFGMRPTGYDWQWSPPAKPVNYTVIINGVNYSGTIYSERKKDDRDQLFGRLARLSLSSRLRVGERNAHADRYSSLSVDHAVAFGQDRDDADG